MTTHIQPTESSPTSPPNQDTSSFTSSPVTGATSSQAQNAQDTGNHGHDEQTQAQAPGHHHRSAHPHQRENSEIFSPATTAFCPAATTFSPDTPVTPQLTSPNASIVAVHGSVTSWPFLRGVGKHGQQNFSGWDGAGATAAPGGQGPESPAPQRKESVLEVTIEEEMAEAAGETSPVYNDRIIAIDSDDVCAQNMLAMITEHNKMFGTDLTLKDLETYIFWQNHGWGSPADVARKMHTLQENLLPITAPVPGFAAALRILHSFGHPIHIVTSRSETDHEAVVAWLSQHGITIGDDPEDTIAAAWYTGTYSSVNAAQGDKGGTESAVEREEQLNEQLKAMWAEGVGKGKGGLGKLKILRAIGAALFIDDHHGNLEPIINDPADPRIPCLLFGSYGWNRSRSGITSPVELMDYNERTMRGLTFPFQEIPTGKEHGLHRTGTWGDVIRCVKEWDREAACHDA